MLNTPPDPASAGGNLRFGWAHGGDLPLRQWSVSFTDFKSFNGIKHHHGILRGVTLASYWAYSGLRCFCLLQITSRSVGSAMRARTVIFRVPTSTMVSGLARRL